MRLGRSGLGERELRRCEIEHGRASRFAGFEFGHQSKWALSAAECKKPLINVPGVTVVESGACRKSTPPAVAGPSSWSAESGADAALITAGPNVRYLTGLASSNAALLLPAEGERAVLATDSRYTGAARRDAPDLELLEERFIEAKLAAEAVRRGLARLAFEAHEMTVERHQELVAKADGVSTLPFGRKIELLRTVKDAAEIEKLAVACGLTDAAFAEVLPQIRPGITERELATAIDYAMAVLGAERPAFDTIVASGPNGAIPHHAPTGRELERGDLVTMDFGALYDGYHADMTRTVAVGAAADWQRDIYQPGRAGPGRPASRRWRTAWRRGRWTRPPAR